MEVEFDCGTIVSSVGELTLAMNHHIAVCTEEACIEDVKSKFVSLEKLLAGTNISWQL